MKGANFINLGEKLITVVEQKSQSVPKTQAFRTNTKTAKLTLSTEDLFELTKNDNIRDKHNFLFGHYLHGWFKWAADLKYKKKPNYEVIEFNLKRDGDAVIKGAYSKVKQKDGEIKKFRFSEEENMYVKSGYTDRLGHLKVSKKRNFFPEKYKDYLWLVTGKDLLVVCDIYGIGGKKKSLEQICEEWGVQQKRIIQIKNNAMNKIFNSITKYDIKPIKETSENKYTIEDYIKASRVLYNNPVYDYMHGFGKYTKEPPIINDEFLQRVAEVRKSLEVSKEWEKTKSLRGNE